MTDGTILSRVIAITANHANVVADQVNPDAAFTEAPLAFDSLDRIELAMLIGEEFGIPFPDADVDNARCGTPAGVAVYVADQLRVQDAVAAVGVSEPAKAFAAEALAATGRGPLSDAEIVQEGARTIDRSPRPAPMPAPLTGEPTPQQIKTPTQSNRTTQRAELTPILHQPFAPPASAPDGFGWTDVIEILHQGFAHADRAPLPTQLIVGANGIVVQTVSGDYWSHYLVSWQEIVFSNTPVFKRVIDATNAAVTSAVMSDSITEIPQ